MNSNKLTKTYIICSFTILCFILIKLLNPILSQSIDKKHEESEKPKKLTESSKQSLMRLLGLKEMPNKPINEGKDKKVYVPVAIAKKYLEARESERDIIPDDRDFLGKLDVDIDLDINHENFWYDVENKNGSYLVVHMNEGEDIRIHGEGSIMSVPPSDDPEDVPMKYEHMLPPYYPTKHKRFNSVHIKYNLSQELFTNPLTPDDLHVAELHLTRDNVRECESNGHCRGRSRKKEDKNSGISMTVLNQRVYILKVISFTQNMEPITAIYDTRRIDVTRTTPLIFDISGLVKQWLLHPDLNHGIIVRITNDDGGGDSKQNNDDSTESSPEILEHVRLKRDFDSDESEDVWLRKRPQIILQTKSPSESTGESSGHVKRDSGQRQTPTGQSSRARPNMSRSRSKAEKCCKHDLLIDFVEVGWSSWIIAPRAFNASYCFGDCSYPIADIQGATNHALIQAIFFSVGRTVPRPCCAPTKFGSLAILFQIDGIVQMKHYDDMIVEACGCI